VGGPPPYRAEGPGTGAAAPPPRALLACWRAIWISFWSSPFDSRKAMRCASGEEAVCGSTRNETALETSCARSLARGGSAAMVQVRRTTKPGSASLGGKREYVPSRPNLRRLRKPTSFFLSCRDYGHSPFVFLQEWEYSALLGLATSLCSYTTSSKKITSPAPRLHACSPEQTPRQLARELVVPERVQHALLALPLRAVPASRRRRRSCSSSAR
jgi:hypothetical protein